MLDSAGKGKINFGRNENWPAGFIIKNAQLFIRLMAGKS
jgi:hypothetical protein